MSHCPRQDLFMGQNKKYRHPKVVFYMSLEKNLKRI